MDPKGDPYMGPKYYLINDVKNTDIEGLADFIFILCNRSIIK